MSDNLSATDAAALDGIEGRLDRIETLLLALLDQQRAENAESETKWLSLMDAPTAASELASLGLPLAARDFTVVDPNSQN